MTSRSFPAVALRRAMIARGWTAAALAREADVDPDTITRALDDSRPLALQTENRILAAIGRHPVDQAVVDAQRELAS